jgi:hypothetical protein
VKRNTAPPPLAIRGGDEAAQAPHDPPCRDGLRGRVAHRVPGGVEARIPVAAGHQPQCALREGRGGGQRLVDLMRQRRGERPHLVQPCGAPQLGPCLAQPAGLGPRGGIGIGDRVHLAPHHRRGGP